MVPGAGDAVAPLLRGWLALLLALALLVGQTGCARHQLSPLESPPPAPGLTSIAALGRTGVVASWGSQEPQIVAPPKGWAGGFSRGAAAGAGTTLVGGVVVGALPFAGGHNSGTGVEVFWLLGWTAVGVALAPLGGVVGGVVGAVKAQPPEQIERSKASLVEAVRAADLPATIRDEAIRLGSERSWHTLVPLTGQGPELGDHDVGTVLEIVIRHVGLERRTNVTTRKPVSVWLDMDPDLELRLNVDATLIKASDGTALYTRSFQDLGAVRTFSVWAAGDGLIFRDDLRSSAERVATQIANALFPAPGPPATAQETKPNPEPQEPQETKGRPSP